MVMKDYCTVLGLMYYFTYIYLRILLITKYFWGSIASLLVSFPRMFNNNCDYEYCINTTHSNIVNSNRASF